MLYPGLEGVTEAPTDPRQMFVSFKVTPSNVRVLRVCFPSEHNTREQLTRGYFFEGLQNYMKNKREKNKNKTMGCTKLCNEPQRATTTHNEPKQPTTTNN